MSDIPCQVDNLELEKCIVSNSTVLMFNYGPGLKWSAPHPKCCLDRIILASIMEANISRHLDIEFDI